MNKLIAGLLAALFVSGSIAQGPGVGAALRTNVSTRLPTAREVDGAAGTLRARVATQAEVDAVMEADLRARGLARIETGDEEDAPQATELVPQPRGGQDATGTLRLR